MIAVDKWHLVALTNQMVTEALSGNGSPGTCSVGAAPLPTRSGSTVGCCSPAPTISAGKQWTRLNGMLDRCDPTQEIGAAWAVKERLRMPLPEREPANIGWRLADFYDAALDAQLPEAARLARTIETFWPAILVALTHGVSNARTEGFNRIIKQVSGSAAAIAT